MQATQTALTGQALSDKHYNGRPCGKCGGTLRYKSGKVCVACKLARATVYRENNRSKVREVENAHKARYPERRRAANAALHANVNAEKHDAYGRLTQFEMLELFESATCEICDTSDKLELDHITPLSHGGRNTVENVRVLCGKCNKVEYARLKRAAVM